MRKGMLVRGVPVALLAFGLSGCGSSGNWQTIQREQASGAKSVFLDNAPVGRPSEVKVQVGASPAVTVRTTYSVLCGNVVADGSPTYYGAPGQTPLTEMLTIPNGPPTECRINLLADKSAPSKMTVTLLMRSKQR